MQLSCFSKSIVRRYFEIIKSIECNKSTNLFSGKWALHQSVFTSWMRVEVYVTIIFEVTSSRVIVHHFNVTKFPVEMFCQSFATIWIHNSIVLWIPTCFSNFTKFVFILWLFIVKNNGASLLLVMKQILFCNIYMNYNIITLGWWCRVFCHCSFYATLKKNKHWRINASPLIIILSLWSTQCQLQTCFTNRISS